MLNLSESRLPVPCASDSSYWRAVCSSSVFLVVSCVSTPSSMPSAFANSGFLADAEHVLIEATCCVCLWHDTHTTKRGRTIHDGRRISKVVGGGVFSNQHADLVYSHWLKSKSEGGNCLCRQILYTAGGAGRRVVLTLAAFISRTATYIRVYAHTCA
jgi:hypothetical protein